MKRTAAAMSTDTSQAETQPRPPPSFASAIWHATGTPNANTAADLLTSTTNTTPLPALATDIFNLSDPASLRAFLTCIDAGLVLQTDLLLRIMTKHGTQAARSHDTGAQLIAQTVMYNYGMDTGKDGDVCRDMLIIMGLNSEAWQDTRAREAVYLQCNDMAIGMVGKLRLVRKIVVKLGQDIEGNGAEWVRGLDGMRKVTVAMKCVDAERARVHEDRRKVAQIMATEEARMMKEFVEFGPGLEIGPGSGWPAAAEQRRTHGLNEVDGQVQEEPAQEGTDEDADEIMGHD